MYRVEGKGSLSLKKGKCCDRMKYPTEISQPILRRTTFAEKLLQCVEKAGRAQLEGLQSNQGAATE